MERRIAPPSELEYILDKLVDHAEGKEPLFASKQKAMMFAAGLGWKKKERTELSKRGTSIRFDIFEKAIDDAFINAMALAETNDLEILSSEKDDERAKIFEEYAHTGMIEIAKKCYETAGDPLETLLYLANETRIDEDPELPGMDPAILKSLIK
ncbi:conserved hypothetical protein [Desulfatibacillum aliphaticivorans]|uniref:Uncharacterized protein n=1 Tax=Desulfatibacillum aliphaticivorans TaxID=218208 RepID=B8FD41_DESAL|nr:DNA phosphorothioation-associated protein 4 [Desulfatibacillum aliphaticivorans]ACL06472.1 conserved hypothetical protein [Desulfatibacillum aliphaticivorans]